MHLKASDNESEESQGMYVLCIAWIQINAGDNNDTKLKRAPLDVFGETHGVISYIYVCR